ncbi:aspartate aminotransferase family protein [Candidatus Enterococcus mansonii]|uniref:Adenosylmethionine-8-amino-7-oxononanoate transaminase n=1 Tax=Candidatus Enterococcus mansonii TaxID=1834181 RepID=A0A242CCG1_9ENTE|nr:aminotransferase class III-fold pyridoxal phosphate-dependent enzyme [Enterococcus sp. 4G2_DIV0659]OTO07945.1 hypothetical protein A5880_002215 [Enterococcus sp. 4G2_DIV0659]
MKKRYKKEQGKAVWNSFKQMKSYLDKNFQVLIEVDEENNFINQDGKKIYDGVSNLLSANVGHKNPRVIKSIVDQLHTLDNSTLYTTTNDRAIEFSEKMKELTDQHFHSCFFTNSGSEACDTAIKIVRKYRYNQQSRKTGILALNGGFHGATIAAQMVAQDCYNNEEYALSPQGFFQVEPPILSCNDSESEKAQKITEAVKRFEAYIKREDAAIGAFIFELIQLSNAVNVLPQDYVEQVFSICKENDVLIIVDEVATGFGRTGKMFASQQYEVYGDLMMTAKGMTSGYIPMGCVMVTEKIFNGFWSDSEGAMLDHGYTSGGHPVACAAALATITELVDQKLSKNSEKMGSYLTEKLTSELKNNSLLEEVKGSGLMIALIFKEIPMKGMSQWGIAEIASKFMLNKGLMLYPDDTNVLIVAPPLTITKEACDQMVAIITETLKKIELFAET